MRVILYTLALCLLIFPVAYAQMDQNQAQVAPSTTYTATVQQGCPVHAGGPASADVLVNGMLAIRVPTSAGGLTAMERAQVIANRLNEAFAAGYTWNDTRVSQVNNYWTVTVGDRMIATADKNSANVYRTSSSQLASRWAQQTVVALGGEPSQIASQLQPVPTRVAGSQQQLGTPPTMTWSTAMTKTVPLVNAANGSQIGSVMVAGNRTQLNMVGSVAVYQSTSDSSTVWTFVPIQGTSTTGTLTRVNGVGLVGAPSDLLPVTGMMTGPGVTNAISQYGTRWNAAISTSLTQNNVGLTAATKIVPLYSMQTGQIIGAVQVIGASQDLANTQSVIVNTSGTMSRFQATRSSVSAGLTGTPTMQNNVVVGAIIMTPAVSSQPGQSGAGTAETTPATPAPSTGMDNTNTY